MNRVDTVVVGGGIAGLTATSYIAQKGISVSLYEKGHYFGGLVNSFKRGDFTFDGGLRSIENSGIVFPMLRELGIDIEFVKSHVSLVVGKNVLKLNGTNSLDEYKDFLIEEFPNNKIEIISIIKSIKKITGYMDILYGIDNPLFLDPIKDREYFIKVITPWIFKFLLTVNRIESLNLPVNSYLEKFTKNQALIDNISQHFFKDTPTSFALSYFSLYNDYNYPIGGTEVLPKKLEEFCILNGAELLSKRGVVEVNPEQKYIVDEYGERKYYNNLIWACDLKQLYRGINKDSIKSKSLRKRVLKRELELEELRGAESVFTLYLSLDLPPSYFSSIATEHCFFTPIKDGLSTLNLEFDKSNKQSVKNYLREYVKYNTFEISIPCLRDSNLAPEGKSGLEISILFDYDLTKNIIEQGWKREFKEYMEDLLIEQLNTLYPKLKKSIIKRFSSTPLTVERYTSSSDGAIIGWAFTNPKMPVIHKFLQVAKSVKTPIDSVYQCGQWTYSPAGLPISILTGKLAANKILKKY